MPLPLPLATARLVLRPFAEGDGDALFRMESDPEVKRFTGGPATRERSDALLRRFIEAHAATGLGALAVARADTGALVGLGGLHSTDAPGEHELFLGFARDAWGHGYAAEAARALVDAAFAHLGAQRVIGGVDPENERSARLVERIGMRRIGTRPNERSGRDELFYVIEREGSGG
ncbi:MAG TPA: GNAT family N-acetyltransferase [Longimicrobium sp.]|nr:GNAT family N-acetyltransferase [Longimicrobium sp.]